MDRLTARIEHHTLELAATGEVGRPSPATHLHYVATKAEPPSTSGKPLVLLLHGFPDFWYSWRHQLAFLADHGHYAVAPDMRGYNLSDKPEGVGSYSPEVLAADVRALIEKSGARSAIVVGHDLGALLAYFFAMTHPTWVERLVILNGPHPGHGPRMATSLRQLIRSSYILFFQLPWLPERYLHAGRMWALRNVYRENLCPPMSEADVELYLRALGGASTKPILNHYRALPRWWLGLLRGSLQRITAPTEVVWGKQDRFIGAEFALPPRHWVPHATLTLVDAGHWVQLDEPNVVNDAIEKALQASGNGASC